MSLRYYIHKKEGKITKCTICKHSGANMRKCKKCGEVYCRTCASKGLGEYKKVSGNKCPHCGALNASEAAK